MAELANKILNQTFASRSEIIEAIQKQPVVILSANLCTKDWVKGNGIQMVYNFITFWSDWPFPQSSNHLLLIFLTFNYEKIETSNFWQRLSKRLFRQKPINDTIKEAFKQLENESFLDKFKVNGVVLPELHNIN